MATRKRSHHSLFRILIGFALMGGVAGVSMACEIDEGISGAVEADSQFAVGVNAPEPGQSDAGYAFLDVGAWDDTNIEWPDLHQASADSSRGAGGYRFLDVGTWDDTNIEWPAANARLTNGQPGTGGYRFLDVGAWDDTNIEWPAK